MAEYRFLDEWFVPAPPETVYDVIGAGHEYPEWWGDVFLEAEGDSGPLAPGRRVRVKARLPAVPAPLRLRGRRVRAAEAHLHAALRGLRRRRRVALRAGRGRDARHARLAADREQARRPLPDAGPAAALRVEPLLDDASRAGAHPGTGLLAGFAETVEVALLVKQTLDALGLASFPKTSGALGLHVLVPIERRHTYGDARRFSTEVARAIAGAHPDVATTEWSKAKRRGVLFDASQNAKGKTIASAYSVRPMPGAPVSTPLRWDEVNEKLNPSIYTMLGARPARPPRRPL
jgi:hypothetical protein